MDNALDLIFQELVQLIKRVVKNTVESLYRQQDPSPKIITVGGYENGRGTGTVDSQSVEIMGDTSLSVKTGDNVVGVPVRPQTYQILGKIV